MGRFGTWLNTHDSDPEVCHSIRDVVSPSFSCADMYPYLYDDRVFKVSGDSMTRVKGAVGIMQEAVGVYKSLTEGDFRGQYVEPEVMIQGITFSYAPPPKDKMPHAACVRQLSESLAGRKEATPSGLSSPSLHSRLPGVASLSSLSSLTSLPNLPNQSCQSTLELDANSSVDSNESFGFGGCFHDSHQIIRERARHVDERGDPVWYGSHQEDGRGYQHLSSGGEYQQHMYGPEIRHGGRHSRHGQRSLARNLDKDFSRVRQHPSSPYTPDMNEREMHGYKHTHRSSLSMRSTHSMPSLSSLPTPPAADRTERDWRERSSVEDKGPRPRSLLHDFQRMRV